MWLQYLTFLSLLLGVTGGMHLYLYRRLVKDTTVDRRHRRIGLAAIVGLWVVLIGAGPMGRLIESAWLDGLTQVAWTWMGVAVYLVLSLMVVGLVRLALRLGRRAAKLSASRPAHAPASLGAAAATEAPVDPQRRLFLSRSVAGGALLAAGGLSTFGAWRAFHEPVITDVTVKVPRLPKALDGYTIVQVSDIHVGPLVRRKFMDEMVARCNALKPDLVAVTGDLVDGSVDRLGDTVSALSNLRSRHGTWFITGNHEYYSGDEEWVRMLEGLGVGVLRNRTVSIGDPGASFDLVGVDDWRGRPDQRYDLERALAGRDPDQARVLLAHQPANFREAAKRGVGLQLSGHTHGGQMFPMTMMVGLQWEHIAGLYTEGDSHIFVHRGTGFWGPPMRVGSPPEIARIVLTA